MTDNQSRERALGAWAQSDAPTVQPDAVTHRGEAARAAARALLEGATIDDVAGRALVQQAGRRGRPRLNPDLEPEQRTPTWNVRMPQQLDTAMRNRARAEGRPLSEVIRQAATEYLSAHGAG